MTTTHKSLDHANSPIAFHRNYGSIFVVETRPRNGPD